MSRKRTERAVSFRLDLPNIRPTNGCCRWLVARSMRSRHLASDPFVLHDRDSKFCASFQNTLRSAGVQPLRLPTRSPNLNAFAERWVRSIKSECLSKLILFGETSLRRVATQSLSIIISNALTKAKAISSSSLPLFPHHPTLVAANATSGSVDCSNSINEPHEYFGPTGRDLIGE